ncbi:MAG: hypothetical protein ABL998_19905, partial [Planctomycetota bacterium]
MSAKPDWPALLASHPLVERLAKKLVAREACAAGNLWGSSQALVLAALTRRIDAPFLALCSNESEAEIFADDLTTLGLAPLLFPARDANGPGGRGHVDADSLRARLQAAQRLAGPPERRPTLVVASLLALLEPVPAPDELEKKLLHLQVGAHLELEPLLERLVEAGYTRVPLVERAGEISVRGDILDVYSFAADLPVRIELFDQEIESLRTFEPDSQRSVETLARTSLSLASDAGGVEDGDGVQPLDLLPETAVVVEIEPLRLTDMAEGLRIQSSAHARAFGFLKNARATRRALALQSLPAGIDFATRSVQSLALGPREAPAALKELAAKGGRVLVLCAAEGERHRFAELLGEKPVNLELSVGTLARGFRWDDAVQPLIVVNHSELIGLGQVRRRAPE